VGQFAKAFRPQLDQFRTLHGGESLNQIRDDWISAHAADLSSGMDSDALVGHTVKSKLRLLVTYSPFAGGGICGQDGVWDKPSALKAGWAEIQNSVLHWQGLMLKEGGFVFMLKSELNERISISAAAACNSAYSPMFSEVISRTRSNDY
jgi:hypothetical protein